MWKAEKSWVVSDSTITNKFGDRPPSTYSMKIQSLSQFQTLYLCDSYKSRAFTSGKHNWKLIIYPKGNEKDKGSGFISMYVELNNASLSASTVLAYLTFFVYNKKENKYFTIQDVEGKQFSAFRPVWGFPQVLPLDTFNDQENGYVFEGDQCEFGVDVMVPLTNWEVVSFTKPLHNPKCSWTLNKFSKLKEHCYISDVIMGRNWVLKLYPKGYSTKYSKSLSLYIDLADSEKLKAGEMIYMRANVRILDPFGCNHVTRNINDWCNKFNLGFGWPEFLSLARLQEAYLDKEGSLNVEFEFEVVSTTKYSL